MSDRRWATINELFHQALERPESERRAFIDAACGEDHALRDEVWSLVAAHSQAGGFLETTAATTIGQYRIERVIGRGGMGVVYLAEDTRLGRRVALKAVSPEFVHDPARRDRLRREARAAAALSHPGIATIYALEEFGTEEPREMFIAAEYIPGETLREEMNRGPAPLERVLSAAADLASALAAAHDRAVIHRDLKPENVMRTSGGSLKILDFGLAQMSGDPAGPARLTVEGRAIGTPGYMAPEQIRQGTCDGRTDIFSLGIVLFEMAAGRHPFPGSDSAATIARILESSPDMPAPNGDESDRARWDGLFRIISRCLAKSPDARFSSAHALVAALEVVRQGGRLPNADGPVEPAVRWWEFHQGAACVSYVALMWPMWLARGRIEGRIGLAIFVVALLSTVTACVLRLHLWFAASSLPDEWRAQREQSHPWLRLAEVLLVAALATAGIGVIEETVVLGSLLVSAAVAVLLSFTFIEPATTRAAFRRH